MLGSIDGSLGRITDVETSVTFNVPSGQNKRPPCEMRPQMKALWISEWNRSQVVSSKQPKLRLMQEFSRISEYTLGYTFTSGVGSFTSLGIDTRYKGPPAFSVSSERHRQCEVNGIA